MRAAHLFRPTAVLATALALAGCGMNGPDRTVTLTNATGQAIRVTGSCVADDPHYVDLGQTDNYLYLGADCRIDNGDGLHGLLGCVTLRSEHTRLTMRGLRKIHGPNDCWRTGRLSP